MKKQQIDAIILIAYLNGVFFPDKGKILSKLQNEIAHALHQRLAEVIFMKLLRQIQELDHIRVKEGIAWSAHALGQQLLPRQHVPFIIRALNLPFELTFAIAFPDGQTNIEFPFFIGFGAGHNQQMICPAQLCHQW